MLLKLFGNGIEGFSVDFRCLGSVLTEKPSLTPSKQFLRLLIS